MIAAHPVYWQWQSLLQLGGSLIATMGVVLLTLILWTARSQIYTLLGLVAFLLSEVFWMVIEAFRLGTGVWATQQATNTTAGTGFYDLLFRWLEGSLFAIALSLAYVALAAYGGASLATRGLPRWVGWVLLAYAALGLGLMVFAGSALVPPEAFYLALLFLGVMLLRSRKPAAASSLFEEVTP